MTGAGLSAIGLSLSAGSIADTDMGSEVLKLATAAQRLHLESFVPDVPNCDMLLSAHQLKVNTMSGHVIGDRHAVGARRTISCDRS